MYQIQVDPHSKTRVRIPAWNYNMDSSESEMACHYLNSQAPGDICHLRYRTKHRCYQACPMYLSITINPILQWRRIDSGVAGFNPDSRPRSEPTLELNSRAASSVGIMSPFQRSQHRKQFRRKADKKTQKTCTKVFVFGFLLNFKRLIQAGQCYQIFNVPLVCHDTSKK